jgi:hypothetical protein
MDHFVIFFGRTLLTMVKTVLILHLEEQDTVGERILVRNSFIEII